MKKVASGIFKKFLSIFGNTPAQGKKTAPVKPAAKPGKGKPVATTRTAAGSPSSQANSLNFYQLYRWYTKIGADAGAYLCAEFGSKLRLLTNHKYEGWDAVQFMDIYAIRDYVADKSIALVANSEALVGKGKGEEIDNHDITIRFNSFMLSPEDTGAKTSIHCAIHKWTWNLEVPVYLRLIFSGNNTFWKTCLLNNIKPEAQQYLGDIGTCWPKRYFGVTEEKDPKFIPTTGFNMIRLLYLFNTSRSIRLYGFDGYKSKPFRLPAAHSKVEMVHNYNYEQRWLIKHCRELDECTKEMILPSRKNEVLQQST